MLLRLYGADLKTVQELLRHTKLATTSDIYMERGTEINRGSSDLFDILDPKRKDHGHQTDTTEVF
ncbi:hypothetical protein UB51_15765 [Paenibacillus sp. IHBB 10380]|nr:hypothetical protein UB51_15765 [Paenibacillus sp. IHBB 10380]